MTNESIALYRIGLMQDSTTLDNWRLMSRQRPPSDRVILVQQSTGRGWRLTGQQEFASLVVPELRILPQRTGSALVNIVSVVTLLAFPLSIVLFVTHRVDYAALMASLGFTLIVVINLFGGAGLAE